MLISNASVTTDGNYSGGWLEDYQSEQKLSKTRSGKYFLATRHLLAKRLRFLRTLRGWSQETLAEHAGLHRTYISGIERGERNLGLDNLDKLAQAFGVTVAELLMGNPMVDTHPSAHNGS